MAEFRVSLNLYNYDIIPEYSKKKKILYFYKALPKIIKYVYNSNFSNNISKYEPKIRVKQVSNINKTHRIKSENNNIINPHGFIQHPSPYKINIDLQFYMSEEKEELALKEFYNTNKDIMKRKTYKELRSLYYSSKIISFIDRLTMMLVYDVFWKFYIEKTKIKTKYIPHILLGDSPATIFSFS